MNALGRAAALAVLCAATAAFAQERAGAPAAPGAYLPLFTPEMIQRASPQQRERMRATEAQNRAAWEARQRAARARAEDAARGEQTDAAPAPRAKRRSRIYRWVDKDGNVHFGDAPQGSGAQEVQVRGVAREAGTPPPPPRLTTGEQ